MQAPELPAECPAKDDENTTSRRHDINQISRAGSADRGLKQNGSISLYLVCNAGCIDESMSVVIRDKG